MQSVLCTFNLRASSSNPYTHFKAWPCPCSLCLALGWNQCSSWPTSLPRPCAALEVGLTGDPAIDCHKEKSKHWGSVRGNVEDWGEFIRTSHTPTPKSHFNWFLSRKKHAPGNSTLGLGFCRISPTPFVRKKHKVIFFLDLVAEKPIVVFQLRMRIILTHGLEYVTLLPQVC